jgi:hypothetical protein
MRRWRRLGGLPCDADFDAGELLAAVARPGGLRTARSVSEVLAWRVSRYLPRTRPTRSLLPPLAWLAIGPALLARYCFPGCSARTGMAMTPGRFGSG